MRIKLVFFDWGKAGQSIYNTPEGVELSMGEFHSGTVFKGKINLELENHLEFLDALNKGYQPVFWVVKNEEPKYKPGQGAAYRKRRKERKKCAKVKRTEK